MTTRIIDGTLTAADIKWSRKGKTLYSRLAFEAAGGGSEELSTILAVDRVAAELHPGTSARFHHFKSMGLSGIYGVRFPDGRTVSGWPGTEPNTFLLISAAALAVFIFTLAAGSIAAIPAFLGLLIGVGGYPIARSQKAKVERDFLAQGPVAG